jgi:hypothetical protein
MLFSLLSTIASVLFIETSDHMLIVDLCFTVPLCLSTLFLNIANLAKLLRLWYVWYRQNNLNRVHREQEDSVFESVIRNREGYDEARREIEAAGIPSSEVEEIQRVELRNARRLLNRFGARALENMNMLRLILNIDGDRDPEDTEENRVILFTKIQSLLYNKEKHSHSESCPICCVDFEEDQYIKILPKCAHIFHEDCIERWILKAKHRFIC